MIDVSSIFLMSCVLRKMFRNVMYSTVAHQEMEGLLPRLSYWFELAC